MRVRRQREEEERAQYDDIERARKSLKLHNLDGTLMTVPDFLQMASKYKLDVHCNRDCPPQILDFGLTNTEYRKYQDKERSLKVEKKTDFKKIFENLGRALPSSRQKNGGEQLWYDSLERHNNRDSVIRSTTIREEPETQDLMFQTEVDVQPKTLLGFPKTAKAGRRPLTFERMLD